MIEVTDEKDLYTADFERFEKEQAETSPAWMHSLRKSAMEQFARLGFPTVHDEEWRFTNVAALGKIAFRSWGSYSFRETNLTIERFKLGNCAAHLMVFVNGRFCRELSLIQDLPTGVQLVNLATALRDNSEILASHLARYASYKEQAFTALNTAFIEDGAFILIPKDLVVELPIHLLFLSNDVGRPLASYPRNLIIAGENSQVSIIESYAAIDDEVCFTNAVTEIVLNDNAILDHYKLQRESLSAFHFSTLQVQQGRSSGFSTHSISLGAALTRNDVNVVLNGEGGEANLDGLYVVSGQQHVDNHTRIDHAKAHCSSRELYKGVLDDKARGVFNGRIIVRPDAQKTDSKQTNKNLLLSEEALANTNPQLEIYADDVKCTHGATIGQLSADALFYLRARGIGLETARNLLTYAFANEITNRIKIEPLREELEKLLFSRLPADDQVSL
jgi:Fe-S cluster assembly protein SufD